MIFDDHNETGGGAIFNNVGGTITINNGNITNSTNKNNNINNNYDNLLQKYENLKKEYNQLKKAGFSSAALDSLKRELKEKEAINKSLESKIQTQEDTISQFHHLVWNFPLLYKLFDR